jgi:pyrroline-5-carboxylate reductase
VAGTLKLGVIGGGGWLAQTILKALLQKGVYTESQVGLSYRSTPQVVFSPGLLTRDSAELVDACETIIVSVRPVDFRNITINASGKLVISVMAGISLEQLSRSTKSDRIIRAMPNVAASVGQSYTPWIASPATTLADRTTASQMFEACGLCDEVSREYDLDYLTCLSGSGPAFPTLLAEALRVDAISRGIAPAIAERAVQQLLIGTGRLFEAAPKSTSHIIAEFVEYQGIVAAAINGMKQAGFDSSVQAGMTAALQRTKTIS